MIKGVVLARYRWGNSQITHIYMYIHMYAYALATSCSVNSWAGALTRTCTQGGGGVNQADVVTFVTIFSLHATDRCVQTCVLWSQTARGCRSSKQPNWLRWTASKTLVTGEYRIQTLSSSICCFVKWIDSDSIWFTAMVVSEQLI